MVRGSTIFTEMSLFSTFNYELAEIIKGLGRKLVIACNVFSVLTVFKPSCKLYDINKSSIPARLAIWLNCLVQKQKSMTKPFYDEISKYSRYILANISRIRQLKTHPKFQFDHRLR